MASSPLSSSRVRTHARARSLGRGIAAAVAMTALLASARPLGAQARAGTRAVDEGRRPHPARYWKRMAAGFATSILAHEAGHVVTSLALGARPSFGLDKGRPTVFSGIDARLEPEKQFLFSSMGLNVQAVMDEVILDVPHARSGPFERGVLAGGIATALFYVTIGRTASVSDMDYMARTSSLSKTQLSLIYGGVAIMHTVRIHRNERYADFFVRPMTAGEPGLRIGVHVQ